jgi:hypothetical protein
MHKAFSFETKERQPVALSHSTFCTSRRYNNLTFSHYLCTSLDKQCEISRIFCLTNYLQSARSPFMQPTRFQKHCATFNDSMTCEWYS